MRDSSPDGIRSTKRPRGGRHGCSTWHRRHRFDAQSPGSSATMTTATFLIPDLPPVALPMRERACDDPGRDAGTAGSAPSAFRVQHGFVLSIYRTATDAVARLVRNTSEAREALRPRRKAASQQLMMGELHACLRSRGAISRSSPECRRAPCRSSRAHRQGDHQRRHCQRCVLRKDDGHRRCRGHRRQRRPDPDGTTVHIVSPTGDVLVRNADAVEAGYRAGKTATFGFLVGQVIRLLQARPIRSESTSYQARARGVTAGALAPSCAPVAVSAGLHHRVSGSARVQYVKPDRDETSHLH